ncbi:MAG: asparaginase domain-containing protein [Bryobacteraceae bacterium]|nr:asparaginase domain-containing protein [Bryobacteraceae bacterium]
MILRVALLLAAASQAFALPTVVILSTGGTISGRHDPTRGAYLPAATAEELVVAVLRLKELAELRVDKIAAINGADMTVAIWIQLANRLQTLLAVPNIAGAIVTHGTNTIEETAYFLDLVVFTGKPMKLPH